MPAVPEILHQREILLFQISSLLSPSYQRISLNLSFERSKIINKLPPNEVRIEGFAMDFKTDERRRGQILSGKQVNSTVRDRGLSVALKSQ